MEELITYTDYEQYKAAMDDQWRRNEEKAGELVEGFAVIGYLLKQARDTDILKKSGYKNVNEFAEAEYKIDKTIVSRYIGINDRFSEMGNSRRLKEHYRGIGYAKLLLMLQMPDEINEEITPAYSKAEVQSIKDEVDAEKKRTEMEVLMEGENEAQRTMNGNLEKAIHQLGYENPELYVKLHEAIQNGKEAVYEMLAPAGEAIHSVRIQGVGRMMLSIKGTDKTVSLINVRSSEKESYSWEQLLDAIRSVLDKEKSPEESWSQKYGEEFPKPKEPVAPPSSPGREAKRPPAKKVSKVTKAKTPETVQEQPQMASEEKIRAEEETKLETEEKEEKIQEQKEEVAPVQHETEEIEDKEPLGEEHDEVTVTEDAVAEKGKIYTLREDAEAYLEKIRKAMEENQYLLAKNETKHLLETLGEIIEDIDSRPMPGQIEMGIVNQNGERDG